MRAGQSSVASHLSPGRKVLKLKKDAIIPTNGKGDTGTNQMTVTRRTSFPINNDKSNGKDPKNEIKTKPIPTSIFAVE
jgi:hypothetical protein